MTVDEDIFAWDSDFIDSWTPLSNRHSDARALLMLGAFKGSASGKAENISVSLMGCLDEWTRILRPYFERSVAALPSVSQLKSAERPKILLTEEEPCHWRNVPQARKAFVWGVLHLDQKASAKHEHIAKLLPFIMQLADDYEAVARIDGMKCISHLTTGESGKLILSMGLDDLWWKTVLNSFQGAAHDNRILCGIAGDLLIEELMQLRPMGDPVWLKRADELVTFIVRQTVLSQSSAEANFYIEMLSRLLPRMSIAIVRHLKSIVKMLEELPGEFVGYPSIETVVTCLLNQAWPRLALYTERLIKVIRSLESSSPLIHKLQNLS